MAETKDLLINMSEESSSESKSQEQSQKNTNEGLATSSSSSEPVAQSTALEQKEHTEAEMPSLYQKFVTSFDAVIQQLSTEDEVPKQKLPSLDIEGVAAYIKEDMPKISFLWLVLEFPLQLEFLTLEHLNIDTLEFEAGIKAEKIVTAHGSHQSSTCQNSSCKAKFDKKWLLEKLQNKDEIVIKCDKCKKASSNQILDFPKCDLLIIMGTSLVVQPFASMVSQVPEDTPRLLINLTAAGQDGYIGSNNLHYDQKENKRDVFYKSTCDEGAMKLARLLGWEDELKAMINKSQKSKKRIPRKYNDFTI